MDRLFSFSFIFVLFGVVFRVVFGMSCIVFQQGTTTIMGHGEVGGCRCRGDWRTIIISAFLLLLLLLLLSSSSTIVAADAAVIAVATVAMAVLVIASDLFLVSSTSFLFGLRWVMEGCDRNLNNWLKQKLLDAGLRLKPPAIYSLWPWSCLSTRRSVPGKATTFSVVIFAAQ